MASIRRTLSPVPRPGTLLSEQTAPVGSPLSKSSSCTQSQNYPPTSRGLLHSLFDLFESYPLLFLAMFSQRYSRSQEKSKLKKQVWRKALCHFFTCFMIGFFVGLTPMMTLSMSLVSRHQVFSYETTTTPVGNLQLHKILSEKMTRNDTMLEPQAKNAQIGNDDSNATMFAQELIGNSSQIDRKLLIIVTPTYARPFQAYYLNRLAHTLKVVPPPLLWVVVEMSSQSAETADMLRKTGVMYRHLVCNKNLSEVKDRSVHQRNVALSHIEMHRLDGIVYFADDDNIYSIGLFEQMRQIRRFGTWPVAKLTERKFLETLFQGPICNGTQIIGWHTDETTIRFPRFHAEMSGFAFNSTILWDTEKWHRPTLEPIRQLDTVKNGFQVSTLVERIVEDESQMEGLPDVCSKIMVWSNLHLKSPYSFYPHEWFIKNNLDIIVPLARELIQ